MTNPRVEEIIGNALFGSIAARFLGFGLPAGMNFKDLFVLACVAAIGFTVSLFRRKRGLSGWDIQDGAKMGTAFVWCDFHFTRGRSRLRRPKKAIGRTRKLQYHVLS